MAFPSFFFFSLLPTYYNSKQRQPENKQTQQESPSIEKIYNDRGAKKDWLLLYFLVPSLFLLFGKEGGGDFTGRCRGLIGRKVNSNFSECEEIEKNINAGMI